VTQPQPAPLVDLDKLETLAKAATPGPWTHDDGNVFSVPLGKPRKDAIERLFGQGDLSAKPLPDETGFIFGGQENDNYDANAAFACAANPSTVLALIQELRTLRATAQTHAELVDALQWLPAGCTVDFFDEDMFLAECRDKGWAYPTPETE